MARKVWYVESNDKALGPFSVDELCRFVKTWKIKANTGIKRHGVDKDWKPAGGFPWFDDPGDGLFVRSGDDSLGPFSISKIRELAEARKINAHTQ